MMGALAERGCSEALVYERATPHSLERPSAALWHFELGEASHSQALSKAGQKPPNLR